jgi:hypothetical protein
VEKSKTRTVLYEVRDNNMTGKILTFPGLVTAAAAELPRPNDADPPQFLKAG